MDGKNAGNIQKKGTLQGKTWTNLSWSCWFLGWSCWFLGWSCWFLGWSCWFLSWSCWFLSWSCWFLGWSCWFLGWSCWFLGWNCWFLGWSCWFLGWNCCFIIIFVSISILFGAIFFCACLFNFRKLCSKICHGKRAQATNLSTVFTLEIAQVNFPLSTFCSSNKPKNLTYIHYIQYTVYITIFFLWSLRKNTNKNRHFGVKKQTSTFFWDPTGPLQSHVFNDGSQNKRHEEGPLSTLRLWRDGQLGEAEGRRWLGLVVVGNQGRGPPGPGPNARKIHGFIS